ncbi:MAG: xylose isomerase, partial [Thermoguttaceae bacterium]|nr:xylose isomerase [Thermoguttaceae bacterium]
MSEFFQVPKIPFEGPKSTNPLAFRFYNPDEEVEGKTMRDHLRFACAFWHTMRMNGSDPFGSATMLRPWDDGTDSIENARKRVRVFFEFLEKMSIPFYCFHDRDVAPEGATFAESCKNLDQVVEVFKDESQRTGVKMLWGTANLFNHPRFMHGAATSPNADAFAYAAAQVKKAIEVTKQLGGTGYTYWGGREGYQC